MPKKAVTRPKDSHRDELLQTLTRRFESNMHRHKNLKWKNVEERLLSSILYFNALAEMEATGGEPDVIHYDRRNDQFLVVDCSTESPKGRRSLCYDRAALEARKEHKPRNSAMDLASSIGCLLLNEQEYNLLQQVGEFDLKSSSWLQTPQDIRDLGGALFGDRRFGRVFIYHNGVQSYYADRGFRGILRI